MAHMPRVSAGLLLYRLRNASLEVLLGHPGGPFYSRKDLGVWSIPKGEVEPSDEDYLFAARREFREETGFDVEGPFRPLTPVRLRSGKVIHAWAVEGDCDPTRVVATRFEVEWPPRSGRRQWYPEIDRAAFFTIDEARRRLHPGQAPWLDELARVLVGSTSTVPSDGMDE